MLGGFGVGKTSLVSRFVNSIFSDKYHSTVGVKVDKKAMTIDGRDVTLMLWDIAGQDDFQIVQPAQLRGAAGYLLVADGTRRGTLDMARTLQEKATKAVGEVPFLLLLNKSDLAADWEIDETTFIRLVDQGWRVFRTSAKSGDGVEPAFQLLARSILDQPIRPTGGF